jgi:NPCBM/NEW2 domain/FecR protein
MTPELPEVPDLAEPRRLIARLCDENITTEQVAELDVLIRGNAEIRRLYVCMMHLNANLHQHASVLSIPRPAAGQKLWRVVYGSLAAAMILVAGLILLQWIASDSGPPAVATVTASSDAVWSSAQTAPNGGRKLPAGRKFILDSGCVELHFAGGCRAVVEGPADFTAVSATELDLNRGRVSATMIGGGFVVRSPTSVVTDLGTQFGVAVHSNGTTEVDVFEGKVVAALRSSNKGAPVELSAGQAARITDSTVQIDPAGSVPQRFVTQLTSDAQLLDVVDLISGGQGTTHRRGMSIDAINGNFGKFLPIGLRQGDFQRHSVPALPVVDSVFVPNGSEGLMQVDSAGHLFEFPPSNGTSVSYITSGGVIPWFTPRPISTAIAGKDYSGAGHAILCLHSNNGLTLDLNAIRRLYPGRSCSAFDCDIGNSYVNGYPGELGVNPLADVFVIVDGRAAFQRRHFTGSDGIFHVHVALDGSERFLTFATTDGGDGTVDDWVLWVDPQLKI